MNSGIITLNKQGCKDCYKCIRNCPVKSISFAENQAQIIPDECILCGRCFVVCPQNAKQVRSDTHRVQEAIRAGRRVVASVAPSFIAGFDVNGIDDMRQTLLKLGFSDVEETAIGAELVSREYEQMMRQKSHSVILSSCCPAINALIQKYYPDQLDALAHVLTPAQAHCQQIKKRDPEAFTVFIGPCIAKKRESDESDLIDVCLTFDELTDWLELKSMPLVRRQPEEADGKRARYYPTAGGILKSMDRQPGYDCIAIDGVENCISALEELRAGRLDNAFIEMSACEGGCIGGPIIREHQSRRVSGAIRIAHYAGPSDFQAEAAGDLHRPIQQAGLRRVMPGGDAIQTVLNKMGKTTPDKELNCGACGYPTCRDKAIAVCQGKAEIEMCLPFLKEKAESFADKIISATPNAILVMNEDLIVQQINVAAMRLFKLTSPDDIVHAPVVRLLDPADYMQVVQTGKSIVNKCHYVAEYKLYVEETILYDRQYRILISIMRDVTARERAREQESDLRRQTIEVTDKVIDKQMRVVQEIASLLGETTAETKLALTKLKDAMRDDE